MKSCHVKMSASLLSLSAIPEPLQHPDSLQCVKIISQRLSALLPQSCYHVARVTNQLIKFQG